MDSWEITRVSTLPVPAGAATPVYQDSRAWAEAEIAEWLSEADEEASAIIDRARAEALRCELAGHEELERLREEAVKVRMATAERVARRLNEARFEADQLLAEAGMQAETMVGQARDLIRELVAGVEAIVRPAPAAGAGAGTDLVADTVSRLQELLGAESLALPGRSGVLDLSGAILLERPQAPDGSERPDAAGSETPLLNARQDRRPADTPTALLALPVGADRIDDIVPATPIRPAWWNRVVHLVRRAA
ncbi:MAG: hypothetical protein ACYCTI_06110 [Acidimicrobiales bacterium]